MALSSLGPRPRVHRRAGLAAGLAILCLAPGLAAQQLDERLIRTRCEAVHEIPDQSILYGFVVDGRSGTPLPGSTVYLSWTTVEAGDSTVNRAAAESADGAYIFCDVPQDTPLITWAESMGGSSPRSDLLFGGGESARTDLEIRLVAVTGEVTGTLTDVTTGQPVEGATITIHDADASTLSDGEGHFRLTDVPIGSHEAEIAHVAYGRPTLELVVSPELSTHLDVDLAPEPIAIEPIAVEVTMRRKWLEDTGFYERRERSLGQFVTPEALETRAGRRFHEILREVPGVDLKTICTPHCFVQLRMASSSVHNCLPTIYMDGRRVNLRPEARSRWAPRDLVDIDALAVAADLAALEVYRNIAETPPEFYGRCGSIVIWTKRGAG